MAIDITGANAYFAATADTRSETWTNTPQSTRIAAIAQAKAIIQRRHEDALKETTTTATDFPRHDAAVYEQAFWIIETNALTANIRSKPYDPKAGLAMIVADARTMNKLNNMIAPATWDFLVDTSKIRLSRGWISLKNIIT